MKAENRTLKLKSELKSRMSDDEFEQGIIHAQNLDLKNVIDTVMNILIKSD